MTALLFNFFLCKRERESKASGHKFWSTQKEYINEMLSGNGSVGNISIDFEMLISCNFNSLRDSSIYRWNGMKCFNSDWKWFKLQFQFIYCTHAILFIPQKKRRKEHETWKQTNRSLQSLRLANCCHFISSHHKLLCGRRLHRHEGRKYRECGN